MSEPVRPRSNIALIVSLCANLLLAGVIAMAAFRFLAGPPPAPAGPPPSASSPERTQVRQILSPRFLSHALPAKEAQVRAIAVAHHDRLDRLKAEAQAARREVLDVFGAPELDKPAFARALARTQAADAAVETEVMAIAAEIAPLFSLEERKKAADWRNRHPGGPFGGGPWQPGGPEGGRHGPPDRP